MNRILKPVVSYETVLGESYTAFLKLIRFIRMNYILDESWDKKELRFCYGKKTILRIHLKDNNKFIVQLVFGKTEQAIFENGFDNFSSYIYDYYNSLKKCHDGVWMFIDITNDNYIDDIFELIKIKKKPNRKDIFTFENLGCCGNNCDSCLIYYKNNIEGKTDNLIFHEMDWNCYHTSDEERADYTKTVCNGCHDDCSIVKCLNKKGYSRCIECDYKNCTAAGTHIYEFYPAMCNLGITADEVTRVVIPYCGKERFDKFKKNLL